MRRQGKRGIGDVWLVACVLLAAALLACPAALAGEAAPAAKPAQPDPNADPAKELDGIKKVVDAAQRGEVRGVEQVGSRGAGGLHREA